jgi:hypothetical protein
MKNACQKERRLQERNKVGENKNNIRIDTIKAKRELQEHRNKAGHISYTGTSNGDLNSRLNLISHHIRIYDNHKNVMFFLLVKYIIAEIISGHKSQFQDSFSYSKSTERSRRHRCAMGLEPMVKKHSVKTEWVYPFRNTSKVSEVRENVQLRLHFIRLRRTFLETLNFSL